jgi:murein DD-endopeptidase MepM/ murein hydrolase activator NlpD
VSRALRWVAPSGGALVPLLLFVVLIAFVVLIVEDDERARDAAACGGVGASLQVGNVPAGPIAGYSGEQLVNAAHIIRAGADEGVSAHGQTIGVMAAMGESTLRVLDRGDAVGPDSRGLFQQRANGAWGSYADRMDPYISATNFFRALLAVPGWETLAPTIAAHRTQRNADPYHYERYWPAAQQVVAALTSAGAPVVEAVSQPAAGSAPVTNSAGPLNPGAAAAADAVWAAVPGIHSIGGTRASAVDPAGHPSGNALDFMVGTDAALGDRVVAYHEANWDALGVEYVIWQQRIKTSKGGAWVGMPDRGGVTENHFDHPHVNYAPNGGTGDLAAPAPGGGVPCQDAAVLAGGLAAGSWTKPAVGRFTSGFGPRGGTMHNGADIAGPLRTPIVAAGDGVVVALCTGNRPPCTGYGSLITVDHGGGMVTRYAHMAASSIVVAVGDDVAAGDQLAGIGNEGQSTGPHLHFELRVDGTFRDPVPFLRERGVDLTGV